MTLRRIARIGLAAVAAAVGVAACGGRAAIAPDAGSAGADGGNGLDTGAGDAPAAEVGGNGSSSFVVTAMFSVMPPLGMDGNWAEFAKQQRFTAVVQQRELRLVAGASGRAGVVTLVAAGATGFKTIAPLSLPVPYLFACGGLATLSYDELSFSIEGGRLTGTGRATAMFAMGDVVITAPATVTLAGEPDVDPPTLEVPAATIDPMAGWFFGASEPLIDSSAASLIGARGDVFALGAQISDGPPRFTTGYVRSTLMLSWGTTYELTTEALVDFAGHVGSRLDRPKVSTAPPPPLVAEDGFESATDQVFAGAGVVAAGPLPPITGAKSLLIEMGGSGFIVGGYKPGRTMTVRLPIAAGDTMARFSARFVSSFAADEAPFYGELRLGVPGREVTVISKLSFKGLVKTALPNAGELYMSPVTTVEVPLPMGATGEASFEIVAQTSGCGLPPPGALLLVDDLRLEP